MFGALNRIIGRLDAEPSQQSNTQNPGDNTFGFQVLRNPNTDLALEPFFDFIIGINGHFIESPDPNLFSTELKNCAGGYCSLDLWSAKGQRTTQLTIPVPQPPDSLGLSLQLAPLNSTFNVWHILDIPSPLSPAHVAGLLPHSDYILGSPSGTLRGEAALGELVEDHLNRSLMLWVYNSEFDVTREVELIPRRGWGGEGALGAILGYGALHRLPIGIGEEVQAPGQDLFDAEQKTEVVYSGGENGSFLPAPLSAPPMLSPSASAPPMLNPNAPPPAAGTSRAKKSRPNRALSPNSGFDDMFAEGAQKSAAQDAVPSRKGTPLAPPPKMGGKPTEAAAEPKTEDLGEPGDAEET
ncbi:uncharacterized protein HMPREF1541_05388 [Cyphellophora europaea CBS 101466]|uniref:PDZ GRASP-type domain-containing protein n=1 Tax=Cyphellophora europaea (strain CBS 101466) TaxID=1220924 RepID=W2RS74_CYPE1|nr:uncharacterized protein HMPREF1541_05388 [Cyphellophora europaea CBS 101466]ETN39165.1 hypothetical protein HMPREF1541_05388 [Cyphellophora europaea CBS 101466]